VISSDGGNGPFFITAPKSSGDTVGIGNAHWRFFVADTNYALSFPAEDTTISIGNASGNETNAGTWQMQFIVTASAAVSGAKTFVVNTANVSASSGSDYTAITSQTETIESGDVADTVFVTINGDATVESNETFTVTISSPSSGIILGSPTVGTGTIVNDDSAPFVTGQLIKWIRKQ
jgi:hypothetical protein